MSHDAAHEPHGDGLHEDLVKLASRRDALKLFGTAGAGAILSTLGASSAPAKKPTAEVPSETAGPFPADGSNGPDVLDESGIVRHDIRRSFGSSRTLARSVPLHTGSSSNLARTSLASDNVFGDDRAIHQLATVTGSVKDGFVANLTVGV